MCTICPICVTHSGRKTKISIWSLDIDPAVRRCLWYGCAQRWAGGGSIRTTTQPAKIRKWPIYRKGTRTDVLMVWLQYSPSASSWNGLAYGLDRWARFTAEYRRPDSIRDCIAFCETIPVVILSMLRQHWSVTTWWTATIAFQGISERVCTHL